MKPTPARVPQLFILGADVLEGVSRAEVVATYHDMITLGIAKPPVDLFDIQLSGLSYVKLCDDGIDVLNDRLRAAINERTMIEGMNAEQLAEYKREVAAELAKLEAIQDCAATGAITPERASNLREMTTRVTYRRNPDTGEIECGAIVTLIDGQTFSRLEDRSLLKDVEYDPIGYAYCVLLVLLATRNVIRETVVNKAAKLGIGKNRYPYTTTLKLGTIEQSVGNGAPGSPRRPHLRRGHIRNQKYGPGFEFTRLKWIEPVFVNAAEGWVENARTAYNVSTTKPKPQDQHP